MGYFKMTLKKQWVIFPVVLFGSSIHLAKKKYSTIIIYKIYIVTF